LLIYIDKFAEFVAPLSKKVVDIWKYCDTGKSSKAKNDNFDTVCESGILKKLK